MLKRLANILLVSLLCLTLVFGVVSCRGGLGLTSEEMEWLGLTEEDLEELKAEMTSQEWEEFVEEVHEEYRMFKQAQSAPPPVEEASPEEGKRLEPIEMLPDKFLGFYPSAAPSKGAMPLELEGMIAGAWGDYWPTRGGGYEDTIQYIHFFVVEFGDEEMATHWLDVEAEEALEDDLRVNVIMLKVRDEVQMAIGKKCQTWDFEKADVVYWTEWSTFKYFKAHGKYLVLVKIGILEPVKEPYAPDLVDEAFETAYAAIKF